MKLDETLKTLSELAKLTMKKNGLYSEQPPGAVRLVGKFQVLGLCRAADDSIVGIAIERNGKKCLVPMIAVREPRKLADYFERIGLVAPTGIDQLKLLAMYVDKVARCRTIRALTSEGIHRVVNGDATTLMAVVGEKVLGTTGRKVISVLDGKSIYESKGDLSGWNETFTPMLESNPLMLLAVCLGLSAPLAAILDVKPMGLLISGPSSTGKTTLARLVMSVFQAPADPHQWASTGNGIEALAVRYRDLPLVLDELGSGNATDALEALYRVSGGITKGRATRTGSLQAPEVIRSPIFATGEISLQHQATVSGQTVRAGHDARMPTVQVNEPHGVFSDIGDAADGAAFSAKVMAAMKSQYGVLMPAFLEALISDPGKVQRRAAKLRGRLEADIAGCDVITLTAVAKRVLDGFVNFAVAGELAIRLQVLDLKSGFPKDAIRHVYQQWLEGWRGSSNEALDAPISCLRGELRDSKNDFVPLHKWDHKDAKRIPGYTKTTAKKGDLYLIYPHIFTRMCMAHGEDATIRALRHEGLLVTDKKGRTKYFQMPGRARSEEGSRMKFYAVRQSILFDA